MFVLETRHVFEQLLQSSTEIAYSDDIVDSKWRSASPAAAQKNIAPRQLPTEGTGFRPPLLR